MTAVVLTRASLENHNEVLTRSLTEDALSQSFEAHKRHGEWASLVCSLFDSVLEEGSDQHSPELINAGWKLACGLLRYYVAAQRHYRIAVLRSFGLPLALPETRNLGAEVSRRLRELTELTRSILIDRPELNLDLPPDLVKVVWTVRIPPLAYLRAMVNLFWSAIRHPLSETTIDLSTGRVLYRT